jgi:hypothetical protein
MTFLLVVEGPRPSMNCLKKTLRKWIKTHLLLGSTISLIRIEMTGMEKRNLRKKKSSRENHKR